MKYALGILGLFYAANSLSMEYEPLFHDHQQYVRLYALRNNNKRAIGAIISTYLLFALFEWFYGLYLFNNSDSLKHYMLPTAIFFARAFPMVLIRNCLLERHDVRGLFNNRLRRLIGLA